MAYRVKKLQKDRVYTIAMQHGVSQTVVDAILKAYVEDLKDSLARGESVCVPGVFSLAPTAMTDGSVAVRGTVSPTLKAELKRRNNS